ncbi:ergosterol biosynthetic protein 28-like [Panicum miliaceum]|uniref:Ergosterol biosynthetic protein 28-like n=1 Tax=Panicum miliaceum TaxID=4540 RepID=A0A3L6SF76_PANMI|nr:ergosterol biosynthetic protein 28-like [Panicum miliaceum]
MVTHLSVGINDVSDVHGRTVGVWTLLSCTLCFLCAFNLGSRPIYAATFLSLVYAYGHFLVEYLLYRTVHPANLAGLGVFAVPAMVWMLPQWNSHAPRRADNNKQP